MVMRASRRRPRSAREHDASGKRRGAGGSERAPGAAERRAVRSAPAGLEKDPSGIKGLDEITGGGLPRGRPTLICGGPGCGKTLLGVEFLVRGATDLGQPGVFVSFEETEQELAKNVASLGFDLPALVAERKLAVEFVRVERSEIEETGDYSLDGLFIRLAHAFDAIGAKRVVLDTIESLFAGLSNASILRAELRRLFRWLKDRGVTAVITGERGDGQLTRQGLEEYVSDCVILLDHRVNDQVSTRRLRIVKYRGSAHGTNEFPFLIDSDGFTVMPITEATLTHEALDARVSSGVSALDAMLGGSGYFRGSSVLVSGTAGTGKSSLALTFAHAACGRGEQVAYFAFEESPSQILRNARSIGLDLAPWVDRGLLTFRANRPSLRGLEMHLSIMMKDVDILSPSVVIVDPITNLAQAGSTGEANRMLLRLVDMLKNRQVTTFFTNLTRGGSASEATEMEVSSIMDTWLLLRDVELSGERNRVIYVLKSRGMAHSNQLREFRLTSRGIELVKAYIGPGAVLTGSARLAQEASESQAEHERRMELTLRERTVDRRRAALEAQIATLRADLAAEEAELDRLRAGASWRRKHTASARKQMAVSRGSNATQNGKASAEGSEG